MYALTSSIQCYSIVVNGMVLFHILTFVVWAIIFGKDLLVPSKHPLLELKKKQ